MAATVTQDSELALQLQNLVQPRLVEAGWSAGDSTLAEYIVLMLVNGKDKDQVASELANDLLGLGPEDDSTKEFAQWLFDQLAVLTGQNTSTPAQTSTNDESNSAQAMPNASTADADMSSGMDVEQGQGIPTGPKSMRNGSGPRGRGGRGNNHANRAMDRSNESMLHKVRNNSSERIGRNTPRGPRGGMHGAQFKSQQGSGRGGSNLAQQQQNQLMQFMNQQIEMMQQMMSGQGAPNMMGMPGTAMNQNFRGRQGGERGGRGGGRFGDRRGGQHGAQSSASQSGDIVMGGDTTGEAEAMTNNGPNPETTVCRFNLKCTKADCQFAHQSPAAPLNTGIDMTIEPCSFGAACQNRKCVARHPSPAKKTQFQAEQDCKFWPNCTNPQCPFKHPTMPMCRNGGDCKDVDCKYTHNRTMCKYTPCMNPKCYYQHAEGQKKASTWVKDRSNDVAMDSDHLSERKFVSGDGAQGEELIKPDTQGNVATADVVT